MNLKTTLGAALLAFGVSAIAAQIVFRGGTTAPTVAARRSAPPVETAGADYRVMLADLGTRIDGLQRMVDRRPGDWLIRTHLGTQLFERAGLTNQIDDYERIQAVLDETFAMVPKGSGPVALAARFNFSIHRLAVAEEYVGALEAMAIPQRDDQLVARLLRGEIALQRGQYAEALATLTELAKVEPALGQPALALYHAKTGEPDRAAALLAETLAAADKKDPRRRAWLRLQLGLVAMDRGDLRGAQEHLQNADAELSGWWLVQEHLAEVHARRGEHDRALAIYEGLVRTADLPQHMDALAALYRHRNEPQRADELIAQAAARWDRQLARFPESALGHGLLHHLQFGAPERALELALANHALRPGGEAHVLLARAHLKAGQPAEALAVAERALATPYRTAGLHDVAAKAHAALGHKAESEAQISLCYAINPYFMGDDHSH